VFCGIIGHMEIRFEYNIATEYRRILFVAEHIKSCFYQEFSFAVLPYPVTGNPRCIYFPDLHYEEIKDFWKVLPLKKINIHTKLNLSLPPIIEERLKERIMPYLNEKKVISTLEGKWDPIKKEYLQFLTNLFDTKDIEIIIRPTIFGTCSSYFPIVKNGKRMIYVYYRIDTDISHLAEVIISSFLYLNMIQQRKHIVSSWKKREITTDMLMKNSKIGQLFKNYTPTSHIWEKPLENNKLWQDHRQYIKKLGFPLNVKVTITNTLLQINSIKIPLTQFTEDQKRILSLLVKHKGNIVEFEDVGEAIWKEDVCEKFSLWSIAKKIERIRRTLREYNVHFEIIETHRKSGYKLKYSC